MKRRYFVMLAAACAALAGCNRNPSGSVVQSSGTNMVQTATNRLRASTNSAAQSSEDSFAQQRQRFLATAQRELSDLDGKIEELSRRATNSTQVLKARTAQALKELRAQRAVLDRRVEQLKASGQVTWKKAKAAFGVAWADLLKTYQDTRAKFEQ